MLPSANQERLAALYDPAFVRHVAGDGAPVQVCVDARMLDAAMGTGVATYARVLAACLQDAGASPALLDAAPAGRARRWLSAADPSPRPAKEVAPARWTARDLFREAQVFFNLHGRLLPVACAAPPAVMHWTYPLPLYMAGAKNLYTVHDLIPLAEPELTAIPRARHARLLRRIVAQAHGLVTVSETVRAQVVERLGVAPDFVANTYQAVDTPLQADAPLPEPLRAGRYFLFCGTVEPRKNLARLAAAHAASGTTLPFVIVGPEAHGYAALERLLAACPGVIRLPWVPRAELIALIRRARALLFPTLSEGFGLPIVEAMTLGCPVLASDRGAAAEIAGEAALPVSPTDPDAIAAAIARLAQDDALCARLRGAGFARGRLFAPGAYARRLRALYAGVLAA